MKKKMIAWVISLIICVLMINVAFAGVTNPMPSNIKLLPGEEGEFKFQIQTFAIPEDVQCSYEIEVGSNLELILDLGEEPVEILKESAKMIYGKVTPASDLSVGKYSTTFCVSCSSMNKEESGNGVEVKICDLPVNVEIVSEKFIDEIKKEIIDEELIKEEVVQTNGAVKEYASDLKQPRVVDGQPEELLKSQVGLDEEKDFIVVVSEVIFSLICIFILSYIILHIHRQIGVIRSRKKKSKKGVKTSRKNNVKNKVSNRRSQTKNKDKTKTKTKSRNKSKKGKK